jgi:hypothetical protein
MLAKQVFYYISSSLFALVILEMGGLMNYLPRLALNLHPPKLSLPRGSWLGVSLC